MRTRTTYCPECGDDMVVEQYQEDFSCDCGWTDFIAIDFSDFGDFDFDSGLADAAQNRHEAHMDRMWP